MGLFDRARERAAAKKALVQELEAAAAEAARKQDAERQAALARAQKEREAAAEAARKREARQQAARDLAEYERVTEACYLYRKKQSNWEFATRMLSLYDDREGGSTANFSFVKAGTFSKDRFAPILACDGRVSEFSAWGDGDNQVITFRGIDPPAGR